ncbi:major facilitator superfamily domain-containing protein [Leucosporidium creatinivorum]|uniref:Major facilitator superfamily domain-containing protein n=1 Tax=Leucosporidium creatinivorum TaxID=106004 RepID=A0A1Y2G3N9_9BASI|nr:major facilitator superfamily domain-containing protein [Leucosporidium creatinivorum]
MSGKGFGVFWASPLPSTHYYTSFAYPFRTMAPLQRQQTDVSKADSDFSSLGEKGLVQQREYAPQHEIISEEDEGGNVGQAEFIKSQHAAEITPEQNKAILRRIDFFLLPLFLLTQTLQYLDKTALNYGKVFGLEKGMGLSGQQFSWVASTFYFGYLVAQMPVSYLIGRFPAGKVMGITCILWGVCVLTTITCKTFATAMVNRFFLGVFEASVTPGLSLMTGFFYTRAESPLRQTIWYSSVGWGGMLGALMGAGLEKMPEGATPKWEFIFIVLGSITIAWGFLLYFFLADGPSNAAWLKAEYRTLAVARVAANGVGIKNKKLKRNQIIAALVCPRAWLLTIAMFGSSVPNGILTSFSGTIIKDMGFSTYDAALLDCAGRSFQIIAVLIAGYVASKFENTRMLMVFIGNAICVMATALLSFLPSSMTWGRLIGFWLVNVQSIGFTLGLVMISSNFGGYTKKSIVSSIVFAAYCAGNIAGPQFVYKHEAPRYQSGAYAMMGGYIAKLVAHVLLWFIMAASNKKRDRQGPADPKLAAAAGMEDKMETENPNFRFVL